MKLLFSTFLLLFCIDHASASRQEEMNMQIMPVIRQIVRFYDFSQDPMLEQYDRIDQANLTAACKAYKKRTQWNI